MLDAHKVRENCLYTRRCCRAFQHRANEMSQAININMILSADGAYSVHTETRTTAFYKVTEHSKSRKKITVQRCKQDGSCDPGFTNPERAILQADGRYKIVGRRKFLTINA